VSNSTASETLSTTFITEDFADASGNTPPEGWSVEVIDGDPAVDQWRFDNPGERTFPEFLSDPIAVFDSDAISNNDLLEDVALVTPTFDASQSEQVFLKLDQEYLGLVDPDFGSEGLIEVYNGSEWQPLVTQVDDAIGTSRFDISEFAAGVADAQVRFRWTGNWSYYWALDNIEIVESLAPGVTVLGSPGVSESNVSDPRSFQFVLNSKPTSDVTFEFNVDGEQLQPIESLTFTPDNWNIPQIATVNAVADGIDEGEDQQSVIDIEIATADSDYQSLTVEDVTASITDRTIPNYTSYRTVEATFGDLSQMATDNPTLASWTDIGDSYDKVTPGGSEGYDIFSLELGNKSFDTGSDKPVLFVQSAIHAREYTTTELVTRFAEELMASYGVDADKTWLLDYVDIRLVPIVNPDGRKFAEQGYSWRKNTNPNPDNSENPVEFPNYGVDLNRNYASKWGEIPGGASTDPASLTYQGPSPFSEPESQALRDYLLATFPDQKGEGDFDPAPDDATGVYLDVHSFGNLVLYPFGWTNEPAPNAEGLRNLGLKFGYYTGVDGEAYDVQQAIGLYPTSGTTDDWVYDTFGAAAYTFELGTQFFEQSDYFEETIVPEVTPALYYAAKSAFRPYQTSGGPDSIEVSVETSQVIAELTPTVTLTATAEDGRYDDDNGNSPEGVTEGLELPDPTNITGGRYSIDAPSWIEGTETFAMEAADGAFDSPIETLTAEIDVTQLAPGRHTIFVESQNASGQYGVPTAVFLDVLDAEEAETLIGTESADRLIGEDGEDAIDGLAGDDNLAGGLGEDLLLGGNGNDVLRGDLNNPGNPDAAIGDDDVLYGGNGDDRLGGKGGNDRIYGDDGKDKLFGDDGDDLLRGGKGEDLLTGGKGADIFALAAGEGEDLILDFKAGEDLIGLVGTLTFEQISIGQNGNNAVIELGKQMLAKLQGVDSSILSASSFVTVSPTA
jgi:Ca2+-binding RTX toxin-like protein